MCPVHSVALINRGILACTLGPPAPSLRSRVPCTPPFSCFIYPLCLPPSFPCVAFSFLPRQHQGHCCVAYPCWWCSEMKKEVAEPAQECHSSFSLIPSCWALCAKHDAVPWARHDEEVTWVLASPSFQGGERAANY